MIVSHTLSISQKVSTPTVHHTLQICATSCACMSVLCSGHMAGTAGISRNS